MSNSPGYGPSSGIPGGNDLGAGPTPDPAPRPEPEPEPGPRPEPDAGRRSRPVDSGIPSHELDEAWIGPARVFVDEEPPAEEDGMPESADRPGVGRGTGLLVILLATAVLLLFVASQAATFLTALAAWPPVVQAIGYGVAAALGVVFAVSAVGLMWAYWRLPVSPRLRVDRAADSFGKRRSVQVQARRNRAIARRRLIEFLDRYPDDSRHRRFLDAVGGPETALRLFKQRDRLRATDAATDDDWILDVEQRFLGPLDELARTLVTRHAVAVGWKTAIVPSGFLDALIVVANAYHLIGALCRLYHLRADAWSTAKITAHVFANTFVAARLEEFTDQAADASFEQMQDLISSQLARGALSRLSSGLTQGTVNGLLLRRFGRYAIRALRPIRG